MNLGYPVALINSLSLVFFSATHIKSHELAELLARVRALGDKLMSDEGRS